MQSKLTLRLEERLIRRAKEAALKRGKSVSQIVGDYFEMIEKPDSDFKQIGLSPIVISLKGLLKGKRVDIQDYREYLEDKYL